MNGEALERTGWVIQGWQDTRNLIDHIIKGESAHTDKPPRSERPDMFFLSIIVFLVVVQGQFE